MIDKRNAPPSHGVVDRTSLVQALRGVGQRLWDYRATVSIALAIAFMLIGIGQIREIVHLSAETIGYALLSEGLTPQIGGLLRVALAVAMISAVPVLLWGLALELWRRRATQIAPPGRIVAAVCAAPVVVLAFQMLLLWVESGVALSLIRGGEGAGRLLQNIWANLIIAVFFLPPTLALWALWASAATPPRRRSFKGLPAIAWLIAAAIALAVVALFVSPGIVGPLLGPFALIGLFAALLGTIGTVAALLEDRHGFPATLFLVALALGLSLFNLNDNHRIRLTEVTPPDAPWAGDKQALQTAFRAWLDCRPPLRSSENPAVYLVAAQGGGLYAAYQSARFLARAEQRQPGFSSRVFAISGVSGGSVGAAVFASLVRDTPRRPQDCASGWSSTQPDASFHLDKVAEILGRDYLSPVGAALLFPDFAARFSPVPYHRADRARALELAFERGYARAFGRPTEDRTDFGLTVPVTQHWRPEGDAPLLLLNTTDVSTGTRMIASSALPDFPATRANTIRHVTGCRVGSTRCAVPRLSTAMLLSARFPGVTPAGTIDLHPCAEGVANRLHCRTPQTPKARFVDGGYFENSGLDTVSDVVEALSGVAADRGVSFRVISFSVEDDGVPRRSYGLGEILSPIRALNSARAARVDVARERLLRLLPANAVFDVKLDARNEGYTLGWVLSRATLDRIDKDLYDPALCEPQMGAVGITPGPEDTPLARRIRQENCDTLRDLINSYFRSGSTSPSPRR
ncbi:MAG: hypothetical protein AAGE76_12355 [Pseudomonadota bacterium]